MAEAERAACQLDRVEPHAHSTRRRRPRTFADLQLQRLINDGRGRGSEPGRGVRDAQPADRHTQHHDAWQNAIAARDLESDAGARDKDDHRRDEVQADGADGAGRQLHQATPV